MAERTSFLDTLDYRALCTWAAGPGFATFRQHVPMMEYFTPEVGVRYGQGIATHHRHLMPYLEKFRVIDSVGGPSTHEYPEFGRFSPNTLRYILILGEMQELFGSLDGLDIVEIGGGFGGQCAAIMACSKPKSYVLIDLPETLKLQEKYLTQLGVSGFACMAEAPERNWDLAISNWALTECGRPVQEEYVRRVLVRSQRGFMYWSRIGIGGMVNTEMAGRLAGTDILLEDPLTLEGNSLIVWGHNKEAAARRRLVAAPNKGLNILGISKATN